MEQNKLETKKCSKCGEVKSRTEFHKASRSKDGLKGQCKSCRGAYSKESYWSNRDSELRKVKEYVQKNKDKVALYQREYRASRKQHLGQYHKDYCKANPHYTKAIHSRRKARSLNAKGNHTAEQLKARFDYHGNKCVYCDSTENLHADHQIPLSRGGTNFASNMVPACASCNCSKGSKTPEEFLVYQFNIAMEKMING